MPSSTRALVTGGGRGIGAGIARELAGAGWHVTITGRTASVGVAAHPGADPAGTRLQDLLLDADLALRAAKRGGRDRIRVVPAVAAGTGPC